MQLIAVKLRNFRGYRDLIEIPIANLTSFIGKNDVGKSTVLEALEIFFNNSIVSCEKDDLSVGATDNDIEITCVFSGFPDEIIIDTAVSTTLLNEHLLNNREQLEIKKVYTATTQKPKEKVLIVCSHPTAQHANDLLTLKKAELKARADLLNIVTTTYNANINSDIRRAIWGSFADLQLRDVDLLVDKEDSKKVFDELKKYLPLFALFQSDRQSKDDDKEVTDPMKIAIQQALSELFNEVENIKEQVRQKAINTAQRTLLKLQEMSPELADSLIPNFRTEPKFDSQFKLEFRSNDNIPINKRGSGVRRLILLSFFRAEAERLRNESIDNSVIYAFEEPETSQHPDHQKMLLNSFIEMSSAQNCQVIITTHTPAFAGYLPLESLRFIENVGNIRTVIHGTDDVYEKISNALGLLADPISTNAQAILLVEGKADVVFINHTAEMLKASGYIANTFSEKRIAIIPVGGCGNLKCWKTYKLAEQFHIPWCVLMDSDIGTQGENRNALLRQQLVDDGIKAYLTRKREPENYIHYDCLELQTGEIEYTDTADAKNIIGQIKTMNADKVLERFWPMMTCEHIRSVECYEEDGITRYEFTEMFTDFLSLVQD